MQFNNDHKVLLDTMSTTEARAYISFLLDERRRHEGDRVECEENKSASRDRFGHDTEGVQLAEALVEFWDSAIKRHQLDIDDIDTLVRKVKERFNL